MVFYELRLLVRKDEGDWVSACRNMVVPGNVGKDRSKEEVKGCFSERPEKGRLDSGLAKDRDGWRAQIIQKMSDLCEHGKRNVK